RVVFRVDLAQLCIWNRAWVWGNCHHGIAGFRHCRTVLSGGFWSYPELGAPRSVWHGHNNLDRVPGTAGTVTFGDKASAAARFGEVEPGVAAIAGALKNLSAIHSFEQS